MSDNIKTDVYFGHEIDFKISTTGVGGEKNATPKELLTVEVSIDDETVDWYAMRNKGFKTELTTGRTIKLTTTYKVSKDDAAGKYLIETGLKKMGTDAMTDVELTLPIGIKMDGSTTIKVNSPGTSAANEVPEAEVELTFAGLPNFTDVTATEATV